MVMLDETPLPQAFEGVTVNTYTPGRLFQFTIALDPLGINIGPTGAMLQV
jgi:hypothetical protein